MVSREGLFAILQKLGCPPTLLSLVKSLHDDMTASVSFEGAMSNSFPVNDDVKQGCVPAPTLRGIFFSVLLHQAFGNHEDENDVYIHTISDGKLFNLTGLRAKTKVCKVLIRKMRRLGHLRRMPDGRLPKDILYSELRMGTRPRGRSMLRFKDVAKRDLVALGVDVGNWEELAEDRAGWRKALREGGEALEAPWLNKD
ncbi:hypothetical protein AWC38_SpisGene21116 [Stylophora pistillata]|uniref:Reverse transcriptase domain-containing protein n=1 Tax=Stylophora pistillata TaxID=50429 RepID=A0A2B4RD31_STYPI|nr:hypothetical protein AWC38_SpisGene21116 [Stylophora pistillata]